MTMNVMGALYISDPVTIVSAVAGLMTSLPCNTTPSVPGDKVTGFFSWISLYLM